MSEFLLIVPSGWTSLDWSYLSNNVADLTMTSVLNCIQSNNYSLIEDALKGCGAIPVESSLIEAKLIDDTYFLVRLG